MQANDQLSLLALLSKRLKAEPVIGPKPEQEQEPQIDDLRLADDIYDSLSTSTIPVFGENRRVERKSGRVEAKVLGEYLSMWANTQPEGGVLLVGVENDGMITGLVDLGAEKKNDLEYLSRFCSEAHYASKEVSVINKDGKKDYILAYRINYREDKVVENSSHKAFVREGSVKVEMNAVLRRELGIAKGEIRYELEPVNLNYPEDFEEPEIKRFCEALVAYKKLSEPNSLVELLEVARLGKVKDGRFTPYLACALLFARDPRSIVPGSMIRILRYDGDKEEFGERLNIIFDASVEGPIPKMLLEARQRIGSQIRSYQRLSGARLERRQEYPESAWFEALVNAVGHRSYNFKAMNIFVKMFSDRIVIESPGGFVPPTTPKSIYDSHNPRNRVLMDAMFLLDLTHCGREGTRRMRQEMWKANLPAHKFVQIEAHAHQVHVILHNTPVDGVPPDHSDSVVVQLDEVELSKLEKGERQVIGHLVKNKYITIKQASDITGRSWPTAQKYILKLIDNKIIERTRKGRDADAPKSSYKLIEER